MLLQKDSGQINVSGFESWKDGEDIYLILRAGLRLLTSLSHTGTGVIREDGMEEDVTRAVAKKNYPASPSLFVLYYTFSCCHLCYCDASSCFAFPSCLVPCRCYGNILANNVTAMHDCDAPKQWNHATQQTHYWYDVISDAARPEKDRDSLSGGCADTGHRPSSQHNSSYKRYAHVL